MSKTIFSMSSDENKATYKIASKAVQEICTLAEIDEMWNDTGLGGSAKRTTVERWLNVGPATKNPSFEPFIFGLHQSRNSNSVGKKINSLAVAVDSKSFKRPKQAATAASLVAYYRIDNSLSPKQKDMVNSLVKLIK